MASTKEMQRRAKAAKTAPKTSKMTKIIAYRHLKNGSYELTSFQIGLPTKLINKNALLCHICDKAWGNNPPASAIINYLKQTTSFAMSRASFKDTAFIINFYETGADQDFPKDVSCRQIGAFDGDNFQSMMKSTLEQAKNDNLDVTLY